MVLISVTLIGIYLIQIFQFGSEHKYRAKAGDEVVNLFLNATVFLTFRRAIYAYDLWRTRDKRLDFSLKKIAHLLFCMSFFELVSYCYRWMSGVAYPKISSVYQSDGAIEVTARFIQDNSNLLSYISSYLTPRPMGIFSAIIGLFILHFIEKCEKVEVTGSV